MGGIMNKPDMEFAPVPLRARHDGWTAERQVAFIEALAESGCVAEACRHVGMSETSAYKLRLSSMGEAFRSAWEAALDYAVHRLEEEVFLRVRRGVARPIFHKGEQVGEWRHYDERLTMFLLRTRRPQRYGKWIDRMLAPAPDPEVPDDPGIVLDDGLTCIEFDARDVLLDDESEQP
jgi:hypothetical protein